MNLTPLAHPLFITGPLTVAREQQVISLDVAPYIGIPYSRLEGITYKNNPDYILTVENLSRFNEYTQINDDNAVIIYTSGYPTTNFQNFYQKLVSKAVNAEIYHWGDTDPHGFQILKTLQRCAPDRIIRPHLMNECNGESFTMTDIQFLKKLLPINPVVDELLNKIMHSDSAKYEQETIYARAVDPLNKQNP